MQYAALLACIVATTFAQQCNEQFFNQAVCLKTKASMDVLTLGPDKMAKWEETAKACFTTNDCAVPDLAGDIFEGVPEPWNGILKGLKSRFEAIPDEQKVCIREQLMMKMYKKIEECTGKPMPDPPAGKEWPKPKIDAAGKAVMKKVLTSHVNVAKAMRACPDKAEALMMCLHDNEEMKAAQKKACEARTTCAGENLQADCKANVQSTVNDICRCAKEKKMDMMNKVKQLQTAAASGNTGAVLRAAGKGAGEFKKQMSELAAACGIDGGALMGDMKAKLTAFYKSKADANCNPEAGPGMLGLFKCVANDLRANRDKLGDVAHRMHDYMHAFSEGGKHHLFCECKIA